MKKSKKQKKTKEKKGNKTKEWIDSLEGFMLLFMIVLVIIGIMQTLKVIGEYGHIFIRCLVIVSGCLVGMIEYNFKRRRDIMLIVIVNIFIAVLTIIIKLI